MEAILDDGILLNYRSKLKFSAVLYIWHFSDQCDETNIYVKIGSNPKVHLYYNTNSCDVAVFKCIIDYLLSEKVGNLYVEACPHNEYSSVATNRICDDFVAYIKVHKINIDDMPINIESIINIVY